MTLLQKGKREKQQLEMPLCDVRSGGHWEDRTGCAHGWRVASGVDRECVAGKVRE